MDTNLAIRFLLSVIITSVIITGCGASSNSTGSATFTPAMTGAYVVTETADADAQSCANYAVDSREPKGTVKLVRILSAEKQVVAGMNYKLKLAITENGASKTVSVVVWSKLDGTKEVMKWE
jgi:hypothetical protein